MPGGDRTGPMGAGPMSGRGAGYCAGYGGPGYMNPGGGWGRGYRGFGGGRGPGGGGRGWRHMYYATGQPGWARAGRGGGPSTPPPAMGAWESQNELAYLKQQAKGLGNSLKQITKRIEELEAQKSSEMEDVE